MADLTAQEKHRLYLEMLREDFTPAAKLEWLNPDGTPAHDTGNDFIQEGTLNVNFQNGMRRTGDIILENTYRQNAVDPNKIWFGQQVRLSMGLYLPTGEPYLLPQGIFYVKNPQEIFEPANKVMRIPLVDKWAYLDGTLFGNLQGNFIANINTNIYDHIQQILLLDRGNGIPIDNVPPMLTNYFTTKTSLVEGVPVPWTNVPYNMRIDGDSNTFEAVLLEFNTMLTGIIGYDNVGRLRIEPSELDILDSTKPVQWTYNLTDKEFLGATYDIPMTDVYNDVIVKGAILNGAQATGRATNTNINSDTCVQRIGKKTMPPIIDSKYYSNEQCQALAEYYLKKNMILGKSISFKSSPMYHFIENNLIELNRPDLSKVEPERHLIGGFTIPVAQVGEMTVNATWVNDIKLN